MITTITRRTETEISPHNLPTILRKLDNEGWKPAIYESSRTLLNLAGIEAEPDVKLRQIQPAPFRLGRTAEGDVFFHEHEIFYLALIGDQDSLDDELEIRYRAATPDELKFTEVGIITHNPEDGLERLKAFISVVERAALDCIDGRKARHINFDWQEPVLDKQLKEILRASSEDSRVKLKTAELTNDEVAAANVLSSHPARELLIEISGSGFVRSQDLLRKKTKDEDVEKNLETLRVNNLVKTEFLLECRANSNRLTRLPSKEKLESEEIASLICASCGRRFGDEVISEGYSTSELGKKLASKSHWMTVWLTNLLIDLGIPTQSIIWNLSEAGEEIDLAVGFLNSLWIFELKDRDFEAGDAYPLNYRRSRYRADKSIILTTGKVSKDAKKVFDELAEEVRRNGVHRSGKPLYIEGLNQARTTLEKEISNSTFRYAKRRLDPIGFNSGFNLTEILRKKFHR